MIDDTDDLRGLVARVRDALEAREADPTAKIVETHISIVLLHGDRAFKFKKPVDLGFADFSTPQRRHRLCREELRLNRRFAPDIYLGLTLVSGGDDGAPDAPPRLTHHPADEAQAQAASDGAGGEVEPAVCMRRFPDDARLDLLVARDGVDADDLRQLARDVAAFHARAERPRDDSPLGGVAMVREQMLGAFAQGPAAAQALRPRVTQRLDALAGTLAGRRRDGWIRDCHGDLHLGNVLRAPDGRLTPFDCIDFNEELRVIDTMADIAFLIMDLDHRCRGDLANAVLASYVEASGDYDGLRVLATYLAYRALVRAKVAQLQADNAADDGAGADEDDGGPADRARAYAALAEAYLAAPARPALWITHGLSGSGKSWTSARLARRKGWIHLRSDIERRRVLGLAPGTSTQSSLGSGAYSEEATARTYDALEAAARAALAGGFGAIVDATFLDAARRERFAGVAAALGVPLRILDCSAPEAVLRERIRERAARGADPSEATEDVLDAQLASAEPLGPGEAALAVDAQQVLEGTAQALRDDPPRPGLLRGET